MSNHFKFGDQVCHVHRPEWGVGSVIKAENVSQNGKTIQRLNVRFANGGMKTLLTDHAELERIDPPGAGGTSPDQSRTNGLPHTGDHPLDVWRAVEEKGWLESVAKKRIDEAMLAIPVAARDPFNSIKKRLTVTLDLYRFQRTGSSLIDWAIAQTHLKDPLTQFTRHDLELLFDRWAIERDNHLAKVLAEGRSESGLVRAALAQAPPTARDAVRRLHARALS